MNDVLIPVQGLIRKLQQREKEQREKLKDAVIYFEKLKNCANTNNQHAIINEALRLLKS